jgi:hypothetical protein
LWITGYGEMAHPLYQTIKDTQKSDAHLLEWGPDQQLAFDQLKQALL